MEKIFRIENTFGINLDHTFDCGQCFRFDRVENSKFDAEYRGVAYGRAVSFAQKGGELYIIGADEEDFDRLWRHYLSLDEDYIMENAHLTAIGTAARLLENGSAAPSDMKVGIIGYGRIGEKLTHILMFLGASVKVFTSKSELRRRLCMLGISAVDYNSEDEMTLAFADLDILINTAPARLISEESAKVLSEKRVIELASGENLPRCLTFERMASIPAVTFPKSAGKAIARSVDRALKTN